MPGSVDATSKLASVVRGRPASGPALGDDDRERVRFPSLCRGRAREHRELNRRDNPRHGSGRRVAAPLRPAGHAVDGKRKPGRAHTRGRGAQCRFGKAPPSRSDRPPQGGRERVGRGSLQLSVVFEDDRSTAEPVGIEPIELDVEVGDVVGPDLEQRSTRLTVLDDPFW